MPDRKPRRKPRTDASRTVTASRRGVAIGLVDARRALEMFAAGLGLPEVKRRLGRANFHNPLTGRQVNFYDFVSHCAALVLDEDKLRVGGAALIARLEAVVASDPTVFGTLKDGRFAPKPLEEIDPDMRWMIQGMKQGVRGPEYDVIGKEFAIGALLRVYFAQTANGAKPDEAVPVAAAGGITEDMLASLDGDELAALHRLADKLRPKMIDITPARDGGKD